MFREIEIKAVQTSSELVTLAGEAFQSGRLTPGDRFPCPDEISKLTGAPLVESLEAVTILLKEGWIQQFPSGRLSISRRLTFKSENWSA